MSKDFTSRRRAQAHNGSCASGKWLQGERAGHNAQPHSGSARRRRGGQYHDADRCGWTHHSGVSLSTLVVSRVSPRLCKLGSCNSDYSELGDRAHQCWVLLYGTTQLHLHCQQTTAAWTPLWPRCHRDNVALLVSSKAAEQARGVSVSVSGLQQLQGSSQRSVIPGGPAHPAGRPACDRSAYPPCMGPVSVQADSSCRAVVALTVASGRSSWRPVHAQRCVRRLPVGDSRPCKRCRGAAAAAPPAPAPQLAADTHHA